MEEIAALAAMIDAKFKAEAKAQEAKIIQMAKEAKAEATAEAKAEATAEAKEEVQETLKKILFTATESAKLDSEEKFLTSKHQIDLKGSSILFVNSINMIKPFYTDKQGYVLIYASYAIQPFFNDHFVKDKNIISMSKIEDFIELLEKFEQDRFVWFVITLDFLNLYLKNYKVDFVYNMYDHQLLMLAAEFVKKYRPEINDIFKERKIAKIDDFEFLQDLLK